MVATILAYVLATVFFAGGSVFLIAGTRGFFMGNRDKEIITIAICIGFGGLFLAYFTAHFAGI